MILKVNHYICAPFRKILNLMGVTRLKRKGRKNRNVSASRQFSIKHLTATPVIKNVDLEELKKQFSAPKPAAKKETPAPKAEAPAVEATAPATEAPVAEAPAKEAKKPAAKKAAAPKKEAAPKAKAAKKDKDAE
ncbi:MAG: hypothetical protein RIG68_11350 [Imperialibacter sp.]|uniref:hypothetical protein n=1 Tax=Imperialibacter sp. TaxID=2038411 RepID=UPI0032ED0E89